jgi:hypothetical protein
MICKSCWRLRLLNGSIAKGERRNGSGILFQGKNSFPKLRIFLCMICTSQKIFDGDPVGREPQVRCDHKSIIGGEKQQTVACGDCCFGLCYR